MSYSFVSDFDTLPVNGRMISNSDLQGVLSKVYEEAGDDDQTTIPCTGYHQGLKNTNVFKDSELKHWLGFSAIKAVDVRYTDSDVIEEHSETYVFVDSSKFNNESYRKEILSKLGNDFGFVELLNEENSLEWVLYDRTLYDIGLSYFKKCFFLYLKPNVVCDWFLYPPVSKSRLMEANMLYRFAYLQNVFRNKEIYFKYVYRWFNYSDSSGIVRIFENSVMPSTCSVKEIVEYLDSLFNGGWVKEDCVFSFWGTIFIDGSRFGRKIAWRIGSGQFSGGSDDFSFWDSESYLSVKLDRSRGLSLDCCNILSPFYQAYGKSFYGHDQDIACIINCYFGLQHFEDLCSLPYDFNSCVFVSGMCNSGKYEHDFCYRMLKNFVVPCKEFLNSEYGYFHTKDPFADSLLYSIDFNGFSCTPETFQHSVLHKSFEVKGGLKLEEGKDYSKMFDLCDYSDLSGRDFRSVLKLVQSSPVDRSDSSKNAMGTSDVLNELKGLMKSGYSLEEARVLLNNSGTPCDDVVEELHKSLLDVCSRYINSLLYPGEGEGSSSDFTIGYTQDKLLAKGYPKDVVNEAIVGYIRDEYLVNN